VTCRDHSCSDTCNHACGDSCGDACLPLCVAVGGGGDSCSHSYCDICDDACGDPCGDGCLPLVLQSEAGATVVITPVVTPVMMPVVTPVVTPASPCVAVGGGGCRRPGVRDPPQCIGPGYVPSDCNGAPPQENDRTTASFPPSLPLAPFPSFLPSCRSLLQPLLVASASWLQFRMLQRHPCVVTLRK